MFIINQGAVKRFFLVSAKKRQRFGRRSISRSTAVLKMRVVQVPVLTDNYSYLLIDDASGEAAAVDPQEPDKVIAAASKEGVKITKVLTTHHHWDHSGGNPKLIELMNGSSIEVYGGDDRIPQLTHKVGQGSQISLGKSVQIDVLFTPCHTTGHVLYFCKDRDASEDPALFSGDTLFVAGCGRFFEGTADQMYHALIEVISRLPASTRVFCGHEYTVKNLQFAQTIEPSSESVKLKLVWALERRSNGLSTIPSTILEEQSYNPFMRVCEESVKSSVGLPGADPVSVMQKVRDLKDKF